jgi:hypothetical protein
MTAHRPLLLSTLLATCCSFTNAQEPSYSSEGRDPGVARWISYEILGPNNHTYPIVYLSTRSFKTRLNEFLTVLPEAKYNDISNFNHARIQRNDCPGEDPRSNYVWYTVKISQRDSKSDQYCILPQKLACDYLHAVVKHVRGSWALEELRPITIFIDEIRCDAEAAQNAVASDHR